MAVLYQVEQQGRQTAFVGEDGTGLVGLYPLLARAAAIAENENSSFAEALSLAAAERGTPLRRVFADEAEALSHDLGHGGAAEQRAVIDLDNGRIRLEYDHRAGSLRESLDALANHFPTAGANRIQNRLIRPSFCMPARWSMLLTILCKRTIATKQLQLEIEKHRLSF